MGSSIAIGNQSAAGGNNASLLTNDGNVAIGTLSQAGSLVAGQINNTAIGQGAQANAIGSTALGFGANANFDNATAIGQGATVTRANQVVVGTATNTYTLSGITSAASLSAQSGPVSIVTTDANGNLATMSTSGIASAGTVAALDSRVSTLETNVNNLNYEIRKAFEGTAVAIAMGGAMLPDNKRFAISGNIGAPSTARMPSAAWRSSG